MPYESPYSFGERLDGIQEVDGSNPSGSISSVDKGLAGFPHFKGQSFERLIRGTLVSPLPFHLPVVQVCCGFFSMAVRTSHDTFLNLLQDVIPVPVGRYQQRHSVFALLLGYQVVQLKDQDVGLSAINAGVLSQPLPKEQAVIRSPLVLPLKSSRPLLVVTTLEIRHG